MKLWLAILQIGLQLRDSQQFWIYPSVVLSSGFRLIRFVFVASIVSLTIIVLTRDINFENGFSQNTDVIRVQDFQ